MPTAFQVKIPQLLPVRPVDSWREGDYASPMSRSFVTREIEYLLMFLEDELGAYDVRVHAVLPTGTMRSPDLVQDYDAESNRVHENRGVRVRAGSREYFFPEAWVKEGKTELVHALAAEIRTFLE